MTVSTTRRWPRRVAVATVTSIALIAAGVAASGTAQAAPAVHLAPASNGRSGNQSGDSGPAVHHDTSPTLAAMAAAAGPAHGVRAAPDVFVPLPHPPATAADPVVQTQPGSAPNVATTSNFDGIGSLTGYVVSGIPSDPNAAVGTTQVFELVNTAYAIYSKTGATIIAATNTNSLWSGFGGFCQSDNAGDATVSFDRIANRWIVQQFANVSSAAGPYFECVAVSTTADATGTYNRYAYQFANFPDYPKTAVWPDAYYVTYNMFTPAGVFLDAQVCAMDRAKMLSGAAASQQCFTTSNLYGGLLAADVDGSTPPPAGEDNTVVGLGATSTTLATWKFHVDWTTPANTRFTGPTALTVAGYTLPCAGTGGTCIPQRGTTQRLDTLGDRIMYRLAYRNFGDHEALMVSHTVDAGGTQGVRWYELRGISGTPSVFQQGTYQPDATARWMPSIAQDKAGNIALGYSQSSTSTFPSIRFTGRAPADPAGTMTQAETTVITGGGSQTGYSRWGDYTSMSIDPVDDCTFWYTDQYLPSTGNFNWQTRLASFQLPGCTTPTRGFTLSASPASGTVTAGASATSTITVTETGAAQSVSLSASGLPAGTTATFNPASVAASGTSTLTLTTSSTTPAGTYPITITGTGTTPAQTTTYTLTVNPVVTNDFSMALSPTSASVVGGSPATSTVSTALTKGANETVTFSASGLPVGVTAAFNPASVTTGASSTLTLTTSTSTPAGTYPITITGTGTGATHTVTFTLTVTAGSCGEQCQ
jgi:hypothetical protein